MGKMNREDLFREIGEIDETYVEGMGCEEDEIHRQNSVHIFTKICCQKGSRYL